MLTTTQKEAFRKIKEKVRAEDGGLGAKQRGDFYYRMSKILKDELEGLDDLVRLMNDIPESYLEKIDFQTAALAAMVLAEHLVEKIAPVKIDSSAQGRHHATRRYQINMGKISLPDLSNITATLRVDYDPDETEITLFDRLSQTLFSLNHLINEAAFVPRRYTAEEFNKIALPVIKSKKNYRIFGPESIVGVPPENFSLNGLDGVENGALDSKLKEDFRTIRNRLSNEIDHVK